MVEGTIKERYQLTQIALEAAFKTLYEENYSKMIRLCLGYVSGDIDMAKDLTQEVFIKIWNNLGSFRNESNINTWMYRIAVNTCLMRLRKIKKSPIKGLDVRDIPADYDAFEEKERQFAEMYRCIQMLGPINKAIILMELEGMPLKEIAQVIGLKHEAIRTRVHRIKDELS